MSLGRIELPTFRLEVGRIIHFAKDPWALGLGDITIKKSDESNI